jgi:ATP-binding cassette subfamily B (MDR/TAP) protein 1
MNFAFSFICDHQIFLAYTIELLYRPVLGCDEDGQPTCDSIANDMQIESFKIAYGWIGVLVSTVVGNVILFHCFGTASERMNKRVRDKAFRSLLRQEVAFFDNHSIGSLSSQLQDDAAMIHSFTGEPIRTLVVGLSSLLVGLVISFVFMWPFALLCLAIVPFMSFASKMKQKMFLGEDEGDESQNNKKNSPGGVVVEALLNIRTVASLCIEEMRFKEYCEALRRDDPSPLKSNLINGVWIGLGQSIQQWSMALMFFWGGWLLHKHPGAWDFRDFLISLFSLMISTSGLNFGAQGGTDKEEAQAAAKRIFHLIDRKSGIDPLSDSGWKGQSVLRVDGKATEAGPSIY